MKLKGENQEKSLHFKFLLLGEDSIGKSSIIERYINNSFKDSYLATIGMDIRKKRLEINSYDIDIIIYDTAGQERFRSLTKMFYKGSDGILLGFDLTNKKTFDQLGYWINQIEANKSTDYPLSIVLFGNKYDRKEVIEIKEDDIQSMKKKYNIEYFSTSAKDGINVQNAFEYLVKKTIKDRGLLKTIGLSPDISFDDIIIKVKEVQTLVKKSISKRRKKKKKLSC